MSRHCSIVLLSPKGGKCLDRAVQHATVYVCYHRDRTIANFVFLTTTIPSSGLHNDADIVRLVVQTWPIMCESAQVNAYCPGYPDSKNVPTLSTNGS